MNEKGFMTILSLCLILVVAIIAKGIQESETNHAYETTDFQSEFELQNAADSAIIAAAEKVLSGEVTLPEKTPPYMSRKNYQYKFSNRTITSERLETITVETWGENAKIHPYWVSYGADTDDETSTNKNIAKKYKPDKLYPSYVFISLAQATNKHTGGKIYRRAYAYVLSGENDDKTIRFMDVKQSNYTFEK